MTFIQRFIHSILQKNTDFENTVLVVPGRRPMSFLRKTFAEQNYTGILPQIITIEELLEEITDLQLTSGIPLLFSLYKAHQETEKEPDSFDDFLKWGNTVLKDFDDLDSSLVNPNELFSYLISEERINLWGKSDLDINSNQLIQNHLGFWSKVEKTYHQLQQNLLQEKKAYRGLLARKAVADLETFNAGDTFYYFVGFNALTQSEEKLLIELEKENRAKAIWDADVYYLENEIQEAGTFLRNYKKHSILGHDFGFVSDTFSKSKKLKTVAIPKQVGQAKYVGQLLQNMTEAEREKTAIVLADEKLLIAVLNAIPDEVEKLNITMGLPLNATPFSDFFQNVIALYYNREKLGENKNFYYKNVLNILENSVVGNHFLPEKNVLKEILIKENIVFLNAGFISGKMKNNPLHTLFSLPQNPLEFSHGIVQWIDLFYEKSDLSELEKENLYAFKSIFIQLSQYLEKYPWVSDFKTFHYLFQQILQTETLSFIGEPLVGLQLLGMLETRLLDFENVILCSVNEGVLPLGRQENTYIPFDSRKRNGMNTFLENDAIYAYHFYRLIQRSQLAYFLYNSETEGLGSGEPSRFLQQLELESPHEVETVTASPIYQNPTQEKITVPKDEIVLKKLEKWSQKGISPSSLNTYVWNPLDFYERVVLGIREEDEVEEVVGHLTLGKVVHGALEKLYEPYLNRILTPSDFDTLQKLRKKIVDTYFRNEFLKGNQPLGKNIIILQVADEMVKNVLSKDKKLVTKGNELIIRELEKEMSATFILSSGQPVKFYGFIDRVDTLNGVTRILDYKTGSVNPSDLKIKLEQSEKLRIDKKRGKALQLGLYAYMYLERNLNVQSVQSGIVPLRYFGMDVQPLMVGENDALTTVDIDLIMQEIDVLLQEILNVNIPFSEPEE